MSRLSNTRSRWGSGSKVAISHVVVGPDTSSALQHTYKYHHLKNVISDIHIRSVKGYPAPANDNLIPVRFSEPPPKNDSTVLAPRPFLPSSPASPSESSSPARCHFLGFPLPFDELDVDECPAVPKILRHSIRVLRGTSNAALLASSSSSIPWDLCLSDRYVYSSNISAKIQAVPENCDYLCTRSWVR